MRNIISILVTSCFLVIIVSLLKPASWSQSITGAEERGFWVDKTFAEPKYNLVVLGDSRVYRGISPSAIEAALPRMRVLNFGFSSVGFFGDYLTGATLKLSPTANPPMLVLGISPNSLTSEAVENLHYFQESRRSPLYQFLYSHFWKEIGFFDPLEPAHVLSDFAHVTNTFGFLEGEFWPYQEMFMDDGWNLSNRFPLRPDFALGSYRNNFKNNRVDEKIVTNLLARVCLWNDQGIVVFAFRMPTTAKMIALENELSGFDEQEFAARFGESGGAWLEICGTCYASYDGSHLSSDAAIQLSTDLGTLIAIILNSSKAN